MADNIVPMPYGKILPDLSDCRYPNIPEPQYLDPILCPNCGSDNIAGISPRTNDVGSWGLWYCISCDDSWRYELDH